MMTSRRFRIAALAMLAALGIHAHAAPAANTQAVEFYNADLQHYFLTADASEALGIDGGSAGAGWVRTGRSFAVWTDGSAAGSVAPVCRFYSSAARSHFFTADAAECQSLKSLESAQKASAANAGMAFTGWTYEGIAFGAQTSTAAGQCAGGSEAITRVYNNGAATGEGSNHRYVSDTVLAAMMVDRGWTAEGVAFCAPTLDSGTSAPASAVTTSFPELAATWTGMAGWNALVKGSSGPPAHSLGRAELSVTIADGGALTGAGNGCTLAGAITEGDGFHSLFKGSVTVTACADKAFNGTFDLQLERAGPARIVLHFGTVSESGFVNVVGVLGADATPPPAPPSATGEWTGTAAWIAVKRTSGSSTTVTNVNQPLTITWDGTTLGGSGMGCTFTGVVQGTQSGLAGTLTAAGCSDPNFNGDYPDSKLLFESGRAMAVILTRTVTDATGSLHVLIAGALFNDTAQPPPAPPGGPTFQLPGTWSGDVIWLASEQGGRGAGTALKLERQTLKLTFDGAGGITGSGFGCAFTGKWKAAGAGAAFSATLSAAGCTNAAFDGDYDTVHIGGMAGEATLGFETHRTTTTGGVTTRVQIAGALKKQ
jgi:hypothetical protein